jgi:hypothetical protein
VRNVGDATGPVPPVSTAITLTCHPASANRRAAFSTQLLEPTRDGWPQNSCVIPSVMITSTRSLACDMIVLLNTESAVRLSTRPVAAGAALPRLRSIRQAPGATLSWMDVDGTRVKTDWLKLRISIESELPGWLSHLCAVVATCDVIFSNTLCGTLPDSSTRITTVWHVTRLSKHSSHVCIAEHPVRLSISVRQNA